VPRRVLPDDRFIAPGSKKQDAAIQSAEEFRRIGSLIGQLIGRDNVTKFGFDDHRARRAIGTAPGEQQINTAVAISCRAEVSRKTVFGPDHQSAKRVNAHERRDSDTCASEKGTKKQTAPPVPQNTVFSGRKEVREHLDRLGLSRPVCDKQWGSMKSVLRRWRPKQASGKPAARWPGAKITP
jgi:hypothetical protein